MHVIAVIAPEAASDLPLLRHCCMASEEPAPATIVQLFDDEQESI